MSFRLKYDVLAALKGKGYSTYFLRKHHIFSESTIQDLRKGNVPSFANIAKLCELLGVNVGDLVEYVPDGSVDIPAPASPKAE